MSPAPETVLRRVRNVVGTGGAERLDPGAVKLLLSALLFDGHGIPDWHADAACAQIGPELFVPDQPTREQTAAAKQVCATCPVRAECLADVLAWEQPAYRHGVVGGLTANERRRLWAQLGGHHDTEGGAAA